MFPVLFSFGIISIHTSSLIIAIGFLVSLFIFWKMARVEIVEVEKIFDLILTIILGAFVMGRLMYVLENYNDFQSKFDRIIHVYKFPGFDFWGICLGFIVASFYYMKRIKIKRLRILDFLSVSISLFMVFIFLGFFFDGVYAGLNFPSLGVNLVGYVGKRLPIQLFSAFLFLLFFLFSKNKIDKRNNGFVFWFFTAYLFANLLVLEFLRRDKIYFEGVAINKLLFFSVTMFAVIVIITKYKNIIKSNLQELMNNFKIFHHK